MESGECDLRELARGLLSNVSSQKRPLLRDWPSVRSEQILACMDSDGGVLSTAATSIMSSPRRDLEDDDCILPRALLSSKEPVQEEHSYELLSAGASSDGAMYDALNHELSDVCEEFLDPKVEAAGKKKKLKSCKRSRRALVPRVASLTIARHFFVPRWNETSHMAPDLGRSIGELTRGPFCFSDIEKDTFKNGLDARSHRRPSTAMGLVREDLLSGARHNKRDRLRQQQDGSWDRKMLGILDRAEKSRERTDKLSLDPVAVHPASFLDFIESGGHLSHSQLRSNTPTHFRPERSQTSGRCTGIVDSCATCRPASGSAQQREVHRSSTSKFRVDSGSGEMTDFVRIEKSVDSADSNGMDVIMRPITPPSVRVELSARINKSSRNRPSTAKALVMGDEDKLYRASNHQRKTVAQHIRRPIEIGCKAAGFRGTSYSTLSTHTVTHVYFPDPKNSPRLMPAGTMDSTKGMGDHESTALSGSFPRMCSETSSQKSRLAKTNPGLGPGAYSIPPSVFHNSWMHPPIRVVRIHDTKRGSFQDAEWKRSQQTPECGSYNVAHIFSSKHRRPTSAVFSKRE